MSNYGEKGNLSASVLYLPIEIKKRELDGQIFLAKAAAKLGFTVFLGSHAAINSLLEQKINKSGIYLDKSVPLLANLITLKSKCEAICIMDAEISPILPLNLAREMINSRTPDYSIDLIDRYFVAGNSAFEAAKDIFGDSRDKVVNTGWPRFDVWRGEGERFYTGETSKLRKKHGNFLLMVSSFGNLSDPLENLEKVKNDNVYPTQIWSLEAQMSRFANYQQTIRIIKAWDSISSVPPIIVRPHPSERIEVWKKDLGKLSKTRIISEGDVLKWIAASFGVIHEGSTVSLQAKLMGKELFFLEEVAQINFVDLAARISTYSVAMSDPPVQLESGGWSCKVSNSKHIDDDPVLFNKDYNSTFAIMKELQKIGLKARYEPYEFIWHKSDFLPRKIRRMLGLVRDEFFWKIGKLVISPQMHKIPWGIRKRDILKLLGPKSDNALFRVKRVTINLWEMKCDGN